MESLENIVSLAKRRGFIYPSSEIYGGFSAVYDYGPYGVELASNIKAHWWKEMVQLTEDIVGLDSAIFMSPKIWEASGHVTGFADPMVEHKETNTRYRVDELLETAGVPLGQSETPDDLAALFEENFEKLDLPSKKRLDFSEVKSFNLLVKSNLGNTTDDLSDPVYLRGETCQGIYVNYKNILNTNRVKIPFGVAQIGKAFRNEVTTKQWIFRTREFEQMEMQYFVSPKIEIEQFEIWKERRMQYYIKLGINASNLRLKPHENLAFYAKAAEDIEYNFPMGFKELEGIHARGNYDLTQHQQHSGVDLSYIDPETNERYLPHIVETSTGVGRNFLMHLTEGLVEEKTEQGERTVLKLPYVLTPVKVAVFPLMKNKPELVAKAKSIYDEVKKSYMSEWDDNGNVGKRYRRQDEIGTPFCVTIDYDSLEDGTVTVRHRDTMKQERVGSDKLLTYLNHHLQ